jgi:type III secretory pathway component EscT
MTQRASESLVAALIRVGLLLALAIMLMAENAQAQPASTHSQISHTTHLQSRIDAASTRTGRTA